MTALVNLGGRPTKTAAQLFGEVHKYFTSQPRSTESWTNDKFHVGGLEMRLVAGLLVEVTERQTFRDTDPRAWDVLLGFPTQHVTVVEEGNQHFPEAGFYVGRDSGLGGIAKASATVRWQSEARYSLDDEAVEQLARIVAARSDGSGSLQVNQPVLLIRSWSLALAARTIEEARRAYASLRSGEWKPAHRFANRLQDDLQARIITMTSVVEKEDD